MKSFIITSTIVILFAISGLNANAKGIIRETENFTISTNDNLENDNGLQKSWTIAFGEQGKTIEVFKHETKNGEEYLVRNKFFEVRYTNNQKGFGVKKVRNNQIIVDPIINSVVINENEMHRQMLLSSEQLNEEKALNYIASFVPFLLNENYAHLLN